MLKGIIFGVALSAVFLTIQAQDMCVICTSSADHPQCIGDESATLGAVCGTIGNQTCYSRVDDSGRVDRGCFSALNGITAADCDASETCELCTGNNCNSNTFPAHRLSCHICVGGVNSTCAGNVTTTMQYCPLFATDDRCYIARPNQNFERGCMSSLAGTTRCTGNEPCFSCTGNGCNSVDYNSGINVFSGIKMIPFLLISVFMATLNK